MCSSCRNRLPPIKSSLLDYFIAKLTLIMFRASGESINTQWSTSSIPVPSPDAWEPNREKSQFNRLLLANWAQFVWLPFIMAAENMDRVSIVLF